MNKMLYVLLAIVMTCFGCGSTVNFESCDAGDAGDASDAAVSDAGRDADVDATPDATATPGLCSLAPDATPFPVSDDCEADSSCSSICPGTYRYFCAGRGRPALPGCVSDRSTLGDLTGTCCPLACVRRTGDDAACGGAKAFSCPTNGLDLLVAPPVGCTSAGFGSFPGESARRYCCPVT